MECLKCQRQWQTFLPSVILTAEEGVLERAPTTVTHVSTSVMHTLWSVLITVHQATLNIMATAIMQVYQSKNVILLSRARRVQSSLKTGCVEAGYTECCTNDNCVSAELHLYRCFCDAVCFQFDDCCEDVALIGCSAENGIGLSLHIVTTMNFVLFSSTDIAVHRTWSDTPC